MYVIDTTPLVYQPFWPSSNRPRLREPFWNTHHFSPTGAQDPNPSEGARRAPLVIGTRSVGDGQTMTAANFYSTYQCTAINEWALDGWMEELKTFEQISRGRPPSGPFPFLALNRPAHVVMQPPPWICHAATDRQNKHTYHSTIRVRHRTPCVSSALPRAPSQVSDLRRHPEHPFYRPASLSLLADHARVLGPEPHRSPSNHLAGRRSPP